jgi:SAM-dependent methyltransferase
LHDVTTTNEQMIAFWNGPGGEAWASNADDQDRELQALGDAALSALAAAPDEAVLDVGCGPGTTTLELAGRVGAGGRVVGLDVSAPLLAMARRRAAGAANVTFVAADAQTTPPPGAPFDAVFSRFGLMFFDQPEAAFANLHQATSPGGRLAFVCWQEASANPWYLAPTMAVMGVPGLDLPQPTGSQDPGPFAFADPDRVSRILTSGGWRNAQLRSYTDEIVDDLDRRVQRSLRQGPAARALKGAADKVREVATARVRDALAAHSAHGQVRLGRAAWIVTARA